MDETARQIKDYKLLSHATVLLNTLSVIKTSLYEK